MKVFNVVTYFGTPKIEERECVKVSEKSIFFERNRVARDSWNSHFCDSYQEAVAYSIEVSKKKIDIAEQNIRYANKTIKEQKEFIEKMEKEQV